jgi:glucose/arabinose dehydrogenase
VVSPDGRFVYLSSGSRTDHGEVQTSGGRFPGLREVPLTAKIFRLPATASGVVLLDDEAFLTGSGFVFARGVRNSFDPAFNARGDLFSGDNSGDRDDSDELNWLREGGHYGFPWRMGTNDTPQQFPATTRRRTSSWTTGSTPTRTASSTTTRPIRRGRPTPSSIPSRTWARTRTASAIPRPAP